MMTVLRVVLIILLSVSIVLRLITLFRKNKNEE